ncbi:D-2-hydroxyacid dehydrogenase [Teredinibacter sp. KSP-S5-2]|uniref:D-2-hydroxyacid dehydrogenase n=1 Tax=Teredinibacter sp. KSP-S5-2 TaxID=3034506 RepID=UPI0029348C10|nr:D-2-hydroxyacid dehydrogenase [Teredinibacter sp. KSP-S5-2]WNO08351.1 D-2-hydroxyacid dehydrogenase [Teredinibacter sp. KSP-S5-2]
MQHKIVFLDRATVAKEVTFNSLSFPHSWLEYASTSPEQTLDRLWGATICITNKVVIDQRLIDQLPDLRLIVVAATGTNAVDLEACKQRGISVCNVRGYAKTTVCEHVFAMILGLRKQLALYRDELNRGRWQEENQFCYFNQPIHELAGNQLGIIGSGTIAQSVAQVAKVFGMNVCYHSLSGRDQLPFARSVPLDALLAQSDIVSLHCPLTEQTQHLIHLDNLKQMKKNALLINTARGGVVDLEALKQALDEQWIAGAGLDVVPQEPPEKNSTAMALAAYPNVILTPHVAWASQEAMQVLADQVMNNIEQFVHNKPTNLVV